MDGKVIIAGGTGLIGRSVCRLLSARGYSPVVLTRRPGSMEAVFGGGVRGVVWGPGADDRWAGEVDGARAVINLTGASIASGRWTPGMRERILSSRIGPSGALIRAIGNAARRPEVLVQGSAAGFYGDTGEEAVSEKSPSGDGFLAEVVRRWEKSVSGAEGLGVRLVLARTAVVLSAEAPVVARMALPVKYFAGGPLGSGRQWMSWIHAEDEARALVFLMEDAAQRGAFNLSSPCPERNSAFMGKLCRALRRPCWLRTPAFVLKAAFGRMAEELILSSSRVSPERLLEAGFRFRFEELEAALGEIFGSAGEVDED